MSPQVQCHYDVLGVARDADIGTIKKAHRKLALKLHPDKNIGNDAATEQFRLVQQAYEVLSDNQERTWYDDHRDAILAGWTTSTSGMDEGSAAAASMLFQVVHYMHPGCYDGYHENTGGFFQVYTNVFEQIVQCERRQTEVLIDLPTEFGNAKSDWSFVETFYQNWEAFSSQLNFAWEDKYNVHEDAPNRRVRRLMDDENKKARRIAKRAYNQDILALVSFVKRRDPRVKAKQREIELRKQEQEKKAKEEAAERKREMQRAKELWQEQAQRDMEEANEADRLAGRVRLADLDDDYDYGGGKKRGKKKKKKGKQWQKEEDTVETTTGTDHEESVVEGESAEVIEGTEESHDNLDIGQNEEASDEAVEVPVETSEIYEESDEEDEEPDVWRCECCRKAFKSEGQMNNHMKSKKHKEAFKKYQRNIQKEEEILAQMMDNMELES